MSKNRPDITLEEMCDLYFNKGLNSRQLAEYFNCSENCICFRFKKAGIKTKSMTDCVYAAVKKTINLTEEFYERIDGEILGDGFLYRYSKQGSFREEFGLDSLEWAEYIKNLFEKNDISIVCGGITERENRGGFSSRGSWSLITESVMELGDLHRRWYVKNENFDKNKSKNFSNRKYVKIIPIDVNIKPLSLLHWYIGDGQYEKTGGGCFLHTEGFTYDEIEYLRFKFKKELNILTVHRKDNTIYFPRTYKEILLEIIGECPVECYKYKWNRIITKYRNNVPYNSEIDMEAVERFIKFRENL